MKFIDLSNDLNIHSSLKVGHVTLYDRGGHAHENKALEVPGYGMIPCSKKLENEFTTDSDLLLIVQSDPDDKDAPYTSDIWITKKNYEEFGNWDDLEESVENDSIKESEESDEYDYDIPIEYQLYEISMTLEEYCEKYDLDIEKAQVLDGENGLIIPNRKGTNYKKILVDRILGESGFYIEDKSDIYDGVRVFKSDIDGVDAWFKDIEYDVSFWHQFF